MAAHIRPEFVKWTYEVVDGVVVLGGKGKLAVQKSLSGALVIPATIDGKPVRVIGDKAFEHCGGLTSVTIPEGVTSIGNGAFGGCGRLTSVTLPSSLVSIGDAAFCWSARLKSVTIPEGVKSVGANAFQRCGFTTIAFPSSVTNIAEKAIWRCGGITSVTLLGERPDAPGNAISECGNLKAIHVPANAKSWAGMKEWQGIPLVFDGKDTAAASKVDMPTQEKISVAQKLESCDFLLNKDFKKNAKYYLCLFSASWCGPCRREMPRIAKMYAETLKADPNIELVHFSRDQNDEKALSWAKEHDVKFPVVKPKGGNPLNLRSRGIPHLFIVKADGTLVEEGHPAKLFCEEKLRALK